MLSRSLIFTLAVIYSLGSCSCSPLCAAETEIQQRLLRQVTVAWKEQKLGVVLGRISETQDLPIWLDRRVDPEQLVDASYTDQPLQQVLEHLSGERSLGISLLGNLLYVGPKDSAQELATLCKLARDTLAKSPSTTRHRWLNPTSTSWPALSQPRNLLTAMMKRAGISLHKSNRISHDLWPARELPRLALVDQTILLLIGFDLTCQISPDAGACEVVSIEHPVLLQRQYRIHTNRKKVLAQLSEILPATQVKINGRRLTVDARWEEHLQIKQLLAGKRARPTRSPSRPILEKQKRFSLQLKNQPLDAVVDQLADQLQLQIDWNGISKDKKETLISCHAKEVSLEELFQKLLAPAGLQFQVNGKKIDITLAPK